MSLMPAGTGIFRDLTGIRFEHPEFVPEKCTGCGDCWVACPDSAVLSLVNEVGEIFETVIDRLERKGLEFTELRKAVRPLEGRLRVKFNATEEDTIDVRGALKEAIKESLEGASETLKEEFALLEEELDDFQFAITKPYYRTPEKEAKGLGGLLSITVNPYNCKGCMECVAVCGDEALKTVPQTSESVAQLRKRLSLWHDLPTTQDRFKRIDDLEEAIGALEGLLLDKNCYLSMVGGDGACLGCSEKSLLHLFTATVTALMQPRVRAFLKRLEGLAGGLETKIHEVLTVHFDDPDKLEEVVAGIRKKEVTLVDIADRLDPDQTPVDMEWLRNASHLLHDLKELAWKYQEGVTGRGRCHLGFVNATGCSSVWGSSYPINPYPFPWVNHLFQDSPSIALGIFEGHMRKLAENFKLVRRAEVVLEEREEEDLTYFNWEAFSDEEFLLCPPVVTVGGDGAMYDIGFQNLSRLMMTGKPIKVVVLDTQVYSNTGGQACTSSFKGQVADMASYGKVTPGKQEVRKEIGLIGMAHRTSYVMQSSQASAAHLMEGFIEGLMSRRPALFNLFCSCQPEHGIADDASTRQARLALESRAYPFFRYNPDKGDTPHECFDLDGNPDLDQDWPSYELKYRDEAGEEQSLEIALTFADYAATEGRFRPHFKPIPRQDWDDEKMKPVSEILTLVSDEREDFVPFVWALDRESHLTRLQVSSTIIEACEDRLNFWKILKSIAGVESGANREDLAQQIKSEILASLTKNLIALTKG
jgi:pyruvate-ferredoxin/flavodoxin oxidoreductase